MTEPSIISPNPPANKGLDYVFLKQEGIQMLQQLSSNTWTDYNEHDPGITTLEQLCYALTELSYRAELPLRDLLATPASGSILAHRHGMFPARRILPCNPVTTNDYRKLLRDRVPGLSNVWVTPRPAQPGLSTPQGLYDIAIYAPTKEHRDHHRPHPHKLEERVRRVYSRHRNLCEDIGSVHVLEPIRVTVHADVVISESSQPESVLANIFFAIGKVLAPELTRQPLSTLIKAGETTDDIFNGPLLFHGFISDDQLTPPITSVAVNDIIRAITQVDSVLSVHALHVRLHHDEHSFTLNDSIPVPTGHYLHLHTHANERGSFTLHLSSNRTLYRPGPELTGRELDLLWSGYRRAYPLKAEYEEFFAMPRGQWRDLSRYYSIQNQYPGVYGIGSYGLPKDATQARQAQARQLKGYLLPFEQLMTDYFAQLANLGDIFSIQPSSNRTCFWQSLAKSVPNIAPLLAPHYEESLNKIVSSEDDSLLRRNHFLEFLLSLYASEITNDTRNDSHTHKQSEATRQSAWQQQDELRRARLAFLHVLVRSTRRRGTGVDYRARPSRFNHAGMQAKCLIEMGLELQHHEPLYLSLERHGLNLVSDAEQFSLGRSSGRLTHFGHAHFRPVMSYPVPEHHGESTLFLRGNNITEHFLSSARNPDNLFLGTLPDTETVAIVWRPGTDSAWIMLEIYPDHDTALREAHALSRAIDHIHHARTQLYIVEHNLLQPQDHPHDPHHHEHHHHEHHHHEQPLAPALAITAVVCLPHNEWQDHSRRNAVETIIRENTPAHLHAQVCFLDLWLMTDFERLYWAWHRAMRHGRRRTFERRSEHLRHFIERNLHRENAR